VRLAAAVLQATSHSARGIKGDRLHALEMLVQSGHARHIESKPHQVIWRPNGTADLADREGAKA